MNAGWVLLNLAKQPQEVLISLLSMLSCSISNIKMATINGMKIVQWAGFPRINLEHS